MLSRFAVVTLCGVFVSSLPAVASHPQGLAGKIITNSQVSQPDLACSPLPFELLGGQFPMDVSSTDTVTLEMAIIPFRSGSTWIGLDGGINDSVTFMNLTFSDGYVAGVPYRRTAWNDVTVTLSPARQEFEVLVNGVHAGPFPYDGCTDGCPRLNSFRISTTEVPGGSIAWVDSIAVVRHSPSGNEAFFVFQANACDYPPYLAGGGIVFALPPPPSRSSD